MKQEQYIPFDKDYLLEQQIAENIFDKKETEDFKKLFEILEHYFHYDGFNLIQKIKRNYTLFDPDKTKEERLKSVAKSELSVLKNTLHHVLERGNYSPIDNATLDEACSLTSILMILKNTRYMPKD
jgi:hypothetical protein